MNNYTIGNYTRISKAAARKLFMAGETVAVIPCKLSPVNAWGGAWHMSRRGREAEVLDEIGMNNMFTSLINSFEYYNCNSAVGYYAAFYKISE